MQPGPMNSCSPAPPSSVRPNAALRSLGIPQQDWLGQPWGIKIAISTMIVWQWVGYNTLIYLAGLQAIPKEQYEAAKVDGASSVQQFWQITLPLSLPATASVITLSLIGGLRSFDLIWAMTKGGPGFASDVIASVIYKQYQAGFYGLSTAGSVMLFLLVTLLVVPLTWWLNRGEANR